MPGLQNGVDGRFPLRTHSAPTTAPIHATQQPPRRVLPLLTRLPKALLCGERPFLQPRRPRIGQLLPVALPTSHTSSPSENHHPQVSSPDPNQQVARQHTGPDQADCFVLTKRLRLLTGATGGKSAVFPCSLSIRFCCTQTAIVGCCLPQMAQRPRMARQSGCGCHISAVIMSISRLLINSDLLSTRNDEGLEIISCIEETGSTAANGPGPICGVTSEIASPT